MRTVPREAFVAGELAEFAYEDAPLPIEAGQTISQPYIVALMTEALALDAAAIACSRSAPARATPPPSSPHRRARSTRSSATHELARRGASGVCASSATTTSHVLHGDGTLGWPEHAPFDAIVVAAGGPDVPAGAARAARGRRPPGHPGRRGRRARRSWCACTRVSDDEYQREDLGARPVRPADRRARLARSAGHAARVRAQPARRDPPGSVAREADRASAREPLARHRRRSRSTPLLERIGDARVVLLGEATHGTSEFYRMRARITRELILRRGFTLRRGRRPTGPTRRASTATSATRSAAGARGRAFTRFPDLDVAQPRGRRAASTGCARTTPTSRRPSAASASTASTSTACTRRSHAVLRYLDGVDPRRGAASRARATAA